MEKSKKTKKKTEEKEGQKNDLELRDDVKRLRREIKTHLSS